MTGAHIATPVEDNNLILLFSYIDSLVKRMFSFVNIQGSLAVN